MVEYYWGNGFNFYRVCTSISQNFIERIAVSCKYPVGEKSLSEDDDLARMLIAARDGNSIAYREFLNAITPKIRRIVTQKTANMHDSEVDDIIQDVLFAIHLKRHTWQKDRAILPWVYAITRYRTVDFLRSHVYRSRSSMTMENTPEEELAITEKCDSTIDLNRQIGKLTGKLACVAKAMGIEGKSVRETGDHCAMSENAVRIAFHRVIKKLRKGL